MVDIYFPAAAAVRIKYKKFSGSLDSRKNGLNTPKRHDYTMAIEGNVNFVRVSISSS